MSLTEAQAVTIHQWKGWVIVPERAGVFQTYLPNGQFHDCSNGEDLKRRAIMFLRQSEIVLKEVVDVLNTEYPNRYYVLENEFIRILNPFGPKGSDRLAFESAIELALSVDNSLSSIGVK